MKTSLCSDSALDDIDMDFVAEYCKKIGYSKSAEEYIRQNKDYIVRHDGREEMSGAGAASFREKNRSVSFRGQGCVLSAMTELRQRSAQK